MSASLYEELAGIYAARRGTYRVLDRLDEAREVTVLRVNPRRDAHRPR